MDLSCDHVARLEMVLDAVHMGTWEVNLLTGSMQWDARMHLLFGLNHGSFGERYEDFLNLVHPNDRARVAEQLAWAAQSGADYDGEFEIVWPSDGSARVLRMRAKPYFNVGNSHCERLAGLCWDVTQRRRTESDLEEKQCLFNALMEGLPDAIYFKDLQSKIIAANKATASKHNFTDPAQLIGKTDASFFSQEHAKQALADEEKIIQGEIALFSGVEKETWPDGHETWASTTKLPLRDSGGKIIGTFGLSRDMTAIKRAEQQLAQFTEELRQKNEILEEELNIAREFQNTLLPQHYPDFEAAGANGSRRVTFNHCYIPSMVMSGDFFDVLKISDKTAGILICDVMGHGVRAALVVAILRTLVSELRYFWADPAALFERLNSMLCRALKNSQTPIFTSAFYLVVDLAAEELRYANAGHPNPIRRTGADQLTRFEELISPTPGPALGIFEGAKYEGVKSKLSEDDLILLFTDGLFEVEGTRGQFFNYSMLKEVAESCGELSSREMCKSIVHQAQQFSAGKQFTDDVCLVAVGISSQALRPESGW